MFDALGLIMHIVNAILALAILAWGLRLHCMLTHEEGRSSSDAARSGRSSMKPQCLQTIRGAIAIAIIYSILNGIWIMNERYHDIPVSENMLWAALEMLILMTLLKSLEISQRVVEISRKKRLVDLR